MNKKFGHIEIPLKRVHIELTNVCDFNCVFCPKSEMKRPYGYMETDLAKRIITEIKENGISEKITFHVMGEPTLHRDFFEILSHARDIGMKVGLTTNGGGLGGKTGKQLLDYDLHQIDISFRRLIKGPLPSERQESWILILILMASLIFSPPISQNMQIQSSNSAFLNTRFPRKGLEKRKGPIKVISTTAELQDTFRYWAGRIYDILGLEHEKREKAMANIGKLSAYKWNVVEIYPNLFFETYVLEDWGHAFEDGSIKDAWAGYCFGMRDHFSILYNGDVALCCIDFNGRTAIGNLHNSSLKEILSSDELGRIIEGFRKYRVIHPYCKKCLGSKSVASWLLKPVVSIMALKILKPFFYKQTKLYK